MQIKQFEDKGLAHFSYAALSESTKQIILIDPARNPGPYYEFAKETHSQIVGVIETHPHADFVSSHLEIHDTTGATIYTSSLVEAGYPHQIFDEGEMISLGEVNLKSLHTPGHSPDSISIVVEKNRKDYAVFTGDTLFIGDVGRPDLRENFGKVRAKREELARQLYHSTREKLMRLGNDVIVYPAHGSGSLCGKSLSEAKASTIGAEKNSNRALRPMSEDDFVALLLQDQPFVPKYFTYDVEINKEGAKHYQKSVENVRRFEQGYKPEKNILIVDGRPQTEFKNGHYKGAINIQDGEKFETWLGSIVGPGEYFYLTANTEETLNVLIEKSAKIGYEMRIKGAFVTKNIAQNSSKRFERDAFLADKENYTIVDIRNTSEIKEGRLFDNAISIPLPELRERANEIPTNKPVVVHCAGGYRSAAGSSILENLLPVSVYDMSEAVGELKN